MSVTRGMDFKLYRNSDTPYDSSPTWDLVPNVRDLTRKVEKSLADASTRGSTFRQQVGTLKDLSVDFQMVYDPADADLLAFQASFFDNTDVEILILDGLIATVGSAGIRFMAQVSNFTVNEALEDVGLVDVSLVPSYFPTNLPRRVSVVTTNTVTDL